MNQIRVLRAKLRACVTSRIAPRVVDGGLLTRFVVKKEAVCARVCSHHLHSHVCAAYGERSVLRGVVKAERRFLRRPVRADGQLGEVVVDVLASGLAKDVGNGEPDRVLPRGGNADVPGVSRTGGEDSKHIKLKFILHLLLPGYLL